MESSYKEDGDGKEEDEEFVTHEIWKPILANPPHKTNKKLIFKIRMQEFVTGIC